MNCETLRTTIIDLAADEADELHAREAFAHLGECRACRDLYRQTVALAAAFRLHLQSVSAAQPSPSVCGSRLLARWPLLRAVAGFAAAAALLAAFFVGSETGYRRAEKAASEPRPIVIAMRPQGLLGEWGTKAGSERIRQLLQERGLRVDGAPADTSH